MKVVRRCALARRAVTIAAFAAASLAVVPPTCGQLVDDFESYADTTALQTHWSFASLDTTTPNHAAGTQSLRRSINASPGAGWFSRHLFDPHRDLTGERVRAWFRRDPDGVAPTSFTLTLSDGVNTFLFCQSAVVEISDSDWHEIVFEAADCAGVDLTDIEYVGVSASNSSGVEGLLAANFDDVFIDLFSDGFESGDPSAWSPVLP